ncbi:MAG: type II toxin-antitoxin system Y4mF family antitoxin [Melioribacteraceae bacterium]|nr:type II toxin-antitoxin system Y4mF family antitoxin [Melioribacteraceae bacterium]MCF8354876.1 type II toxin-antitoxin system Y4mF family antitoxin [Melioribacteraceae bacterium]MCF8393902.1 type II toxin-antitoxin system Y4mF family antitoxin [Melioribacteraceae bacterium]MCF8419674.1 type II toxin-antitoxin system Y4mF family antitoxin [Melioribacteraceae bacterium]
MKRLGKIIRGHRKKAGLTQKELADLSGVGKTVIFDIEKGKETVQLNSLMNVLKTLNIKLKVESRLMDGEEVINEES